jgi:hypothetical protein
MEDSMSRRSNRNTTFPFVTSPVLPGAIFNTPAALHEFCREALEIERIISAFEQDRDELALTVDLESFGFDVAEIGEIVAQPKVRPQVMYATL